MSENFRRGLLLLGAVIGLSVAALEAVTLRRAADGGDAAAIVNDVVISQSDYRKALGILSTARRGAMTEADRDHVLGRLVEEELLFQRAEEIGLLRSHGNLRAGIVRAMVQFILDDVALETPSDDALRAFYKDNKSWFARNERARVSRIYLRTGADAAKRAQEITEALRQGKDFDELAQKGDATAIEVPDVLLPREKLIEYLGAGLVEQLDQMKPGDISGAIRTPSGVHFLLLRAHEKVKLPRFEDIKPQVARYYMRRRDDEKLKNYIARLRDESEIKLFP